MMARLTSHSTRAYLRLIAPFAVTLLWLAVSSSVLAADAVPTGAKEALAPVTKMITTLVAIAIGLGIAICGAVIVWGGIEKTLAGSNQDAEHRSQRRIQRCPGSRGSPRRRSAGSPSGRCTPTRHSSD